jgi:hypothetical protein
MAPDRKAESSGASYGAGRGVGQAASLDNRSLRLLPSDVEGTRCSKPLTHSGSPFSGMSHPRKAFGSFRMWVEGYPA